MRLNQLEKIKGSHVLLMGDPKTGKSTLASQLALSGYHLKWLSTDSGHSIIGKLPPEAIDLIDIVAVADTRGYPIASQLVNQLIVEPQACHICGHHGVHDCDRCKKAGSLAIWTDWDFSKLDAKKDVVVLDHISGIGDSYMNNVTKGKAVDYKPQLDDWGSLRFHLGALGLAIQNAPYNIVCICHSSLEELEDKSKKLVPQVGSGTTSRGFAKYFDHVAYLDIRNGSHRAGSATTYMTNVVTGSRTDIHIENMDTPTLVPFFDGSVTTVKEVAGSAADKKTAGSSIAAMLAKANAK